MQVIREATAGSALEIPKGARILIACEDRSTTERLETAFRQAGLVSESATSISEACDSAKSGRFQVVASAPRLGDGSWESLVAIAKHYDLAFEVVLLARGFDLVDWSEAFRNGAFDVLDATRELPKAVEAVKRALWAAYLRGAGPYPEAARRREAA